jgi:hypothetical protein
MPKSRIKRDNRKTALSNAIKRQLNGRYTNPATSRRVIEIAERITRQEAKVIAAATDTVVDWDKREYARKQGLRQPSFAKPFSGRSLVTVTPLDSLTESERKSKLIRKPDHCLV